MSENRNIFTLVFIGMLLILVTLAACGDDSTTLSLDSVDDGVSNPPDPGGTNTVDALSSGYFFFLGDDGFHGPELWVTDGTETGTRMVTTTGIQPSAIAEIGNIAYFTGFDGVHDGELWTSDGTEAGTRLVKDINQTGSYLSFSSPNGFTLYNGKVYFTAMDGVRGKQVWVTDGTEAGTKMLAEIGIGSGWDPAYTGSDPKSYIEYKGLLYFSADDGVHGGQLWVTDGTEAGTRVFAGLRAGDSPVCSYSSPFLVHNGLLHIYCQGDTAFQVWTTDGSVEGTVKLFNSSRAGLTLYNGKFYYRGYDSLNGHELWVTDGTPEGTGLLVNINKTGGSSPSDFVVYNGLLYMRADDGINGFSLVSTDGAEAGTKTVAPVNLSGLKEVNGKLVFGGHVPGEGYELWVSDGTTEGTFMIDINPGIGNSSLGSGFLGR